MAKHLGDTLRVNTYHYDYDGATLITPDTWSIIFYDPQGTAKGTVTTPTYISSGYYYATHNTAATDVPGVWKCRWKSTYNAAVDAEEIFIEVRT